MNDRTAELERALEDWAAAERRGDAAYLQSALADDFVGIGPRGFMLTKEEWLERHESGKLHYESLEWDEVGVRLYGDAAIVTGRQSAQGKYENYELRDRFRGTLVFVRDERWLLAGLQLSPIAGPPS